MQRQDTETDVPLRLRYFAVPVEDLGSTLALAVVFAWTAAPMVNAAPVPASLDQVVGEAIEFIAAVASEANAGDRPWSDAQELSTTVRAVYVDPSDFRPDRFQPLSVVVRMEDSMTMASLDQRIRAEYAAHRHNQSWLLNKTW